MNDSTSGNDLPRGIALTPLDERFRSDPYPILAELRSRAPVHEDTALKRFICTRHDEVFEILRDREFWSDPRKANPGTFSREFLGANSDEEPSMLLMDEPGHRRLRSLVSSSFTPAAVERWRPRIREVIARVLDGIRDAEFDLIAAFAGPVPTVVIAEMLGIDPSRHGDFNTWSDQSVTVGFNPFATAEEKSVAEAARASLEAFFGEEIAARRACPGDDLISDMLRADPALIRNAVEEILRFDSPVVNSGRIANRDIDIGGCPVHRGESLSTSLAAANRDPAVYPDPDRSDIERADTHHQSFGGGRHLCLGAHLARAEAQEAILALVARFPDLRHGAGGLRHHAIPSFRGMASFMVRG